MSGEPGNSKISAQWKSQNLKKPNLCFDYILTWYELHWWRRQWHPTPVLLPRKSHGQRSLVGCSPWGREESDRTERLNCHFHFHALEKEMATHSSVLAWRIPGTGEPGGLLSVASHRVRHDWSDLAGKAGVLQSMGSQRVGQDMTEWLNWTKLTKLNFPVALVNMNTFTS